MKRLIAGGYARAGAKGIVPLSLGANRLSATDPLAPFTGVSAGVQAEGRWLIVDEEASRVRLVDPAQGWRETASAPSGGDAPCHLAFAASHRLLAVANYESGSVALFRVDPAADAPFGEPAIFHGSGTGPNAERQEGPHAHWVGFAHDGRLFTTDLGADRIHVFDPDTDPELSAPAFSWTAPAGSGPRQLVFHPRLPILYLVSELASTLTVLRIGDHGLEAADTLSTLPGPAAIESLGGAIAIDVAGKRLHVSNRGHDSIATFALDAEGNAVLLGHAPSGGSSPRFLLLLEDDRVLLVAHERAGGVTLLALDNEGRPRSTPLRVDLPGVAFLGVLT